MLRGVTLALVVVLGLGLVALLGYGVASRAPDRTIDDRLAAGKASEAPAFKLDVLTPGQVPASLRATFQEAAADGSVALAELRGVPVVLNFWASWCEPCRVEAPVLEEGWKKAGPQGVLMLGLSMQDIRSDARDFIREVGTTYPNIRDPEDTTSRKYKATGLPETFFIDARGRIVHHVVGALDRAQLAAGIQAARDGRPLTAQDGGARRTTR